MRDQFGSQVGTHGADRRDYKLSVQGTRFTTVLGPGSDAAHTDHLHVDMALHGTSDRYRICQ